MKKREEIKDNEKIIAQLEYELEVIDKEIELLKQDPDVQKYIELISNSKSVYEFIKAQNNERNKRALLNHKKEILKALFVEPCSHQLVFVDDEIDDEKVFYNCVCLDCGRRMRLNLDDFYICVLDTLDNDIIANIKMNYQKLIMSGEKIAITDIKVNKKVKSRK